MITEHASFRKFLSQNSVFDKQWLITWL